VITTYKEPDSYEQTFCDRNCASCDLLLNIEDADDSRSIGIDKLLSDHDDTISLVPVSNDRHRRRNNHA